MQIQIWILYSVGMNSVLIFDAMVDNSQKSLGVPKTLVRKFWLYPPPPPPPGKGSKWGKTVQISRKSSKLALLRRGGGNAILWTIRFYRHLGLPETGINEVQSQLLTAEGLGEQRPLNDAKRRLSTVLKSSWQSRSSCNHEASDQVSAYLSQMPAAIYRSAQGPGPESAPWSAFWAILGTWLRVPQGVLFECFLALLGLRKRQKALKKHSLEHSEPGAQNRSKSTSGALSGPGPWALL